MSRMTGLGKGLDALFRGNIEEEIEKVTEGEKQELVKEIKIIEIEPNKNQPRRKFDEEALEELSESIKKYGVLQPIIVTKKENYYEIIAGERRWRAAKKAGLKAIPAIVKEIDEQTNKEIALIENIQRQDLNPIEKARAIKTLMVEHALTQQQAADTLGMARSALANTIRLLNLDERVIELATEGKLTEGHCRALLGIEDPDKQYETALYVIESGATVREAESKMESRTKKSGKKAKNSGQMEAIYRDIETNFRDFFGTKVKLQPKERSGKIVISYSSADELGRLVDIIKGNMN